ncbi:MAG: hypothetical protein SX243_01020 [Acidobacteriota bacterium]|nr:hypothetical protein [Acidobacteriota bacterium]
MAKCDFKFSLVQSVINPADWKLDMVSLSADGVLNNLGTVSAQMPRGQMRVASDKCDWSVNLLQNRVGKFRQPGVNATLSASKCDFRINLEFGLQEGRQFRLGAVSSSKCDFRIERFQTYDPRERSWTESKLPESSD